MASRDVEEGQASQRPTVFQSQLDAERHCRRLEASLAAALDKILRLEASSAADWEKRQHLEESLAAEKEKALRLEADVLAAEREKTQHLEATNKLLRKVVAQEQAKRKEELGNLIREFREVTSLVYQMKQAYEENIREKDEELAMEKELRLQMQRRMHRDRAEPSPSGSRSGRRRGPRVDDDVAAEPPAAAPSDDKAPSASG